METNRITSEKMYSPLTEEDILKAAKEVFGDADDFWKGLHPSVQRAVIKAAKEGMFDVEGRRAEREAQLKELGLTKEDVELKPKVYNVGGFEIRFDLPDSCK